MRSTQRQRNEENDDLCQDVLSQALSAGCGSDVGGGVGITGLSSDCSGGVFVKMCCHFGGVTLGDGHEPALRFIVGVHIP